MENRYVNNSVNAEASTNDLLRELILEIKALRAQLANQHASTLSKQEHHHHYHYPQTAYPSPWISPWVTTC